MTYADPDTTRHMVAFEKAAKAVQTLLRKLAKGELGSEGDGGLKVRKAINKLEDRAYKAEIRGDDAARDAAERILGDLRSAVSPAREACHAARQAHYASEDARLRQEIRDARPRPGTHEHDLGMMRVREDARLRAMKQEEDAAAERLRKAMGGR